MTARYAVIGHPLGHSLSPLLHNWGFRECGLDARYEAIPVTPAELTSFLVRARVEPLAGLSVTIPHKQTIMGLLDKVTFAASSVGAVNTVFWEDNRLWGENTDVLGVSEPLRGLGPFHSALVLGAGGAARAVVFALGELKVPEILVAARDQNKAAALAAGFGARPLAWEDRATVQTRLIVNTTPLGMLGERQDLSPWPKDAPLPPAATVFDVVYNPLVTRFLAQAQAAGCHTVSGLEMFLHQGLAQFRTWTGQDLDPDKVRDVLRQALEK
jgi:shikimate dehydrogenase